MASVVAPFALLAAVVNALAAALGAWRWSRGGQPDAWFWRLVRAGQAAAGLLAPAPGGAAATGGRPAGRVFWLYGGAPPAGRPGAGPLRPPPPPAAPAPRGPPDP